MATKNKNNKVATVKKDVIVVTNHMKCCWVVPHGLIIDMKDLDPADKNHRLILLNTKPRFIEPLSFTYLARDCFDKYYKNNRAFQALIDTKRLVCKKKQISIHELKEIETAGADELAPELVKDSTNMHTETLVSDELMKIKTSQAGM